MPARMAIHRAAKPSASIRVLRAVFWAFPGSWHHSVFGQLLGNFFQRVMEDVADISGTQSRARANLLVGQAFVELEPDQFAAAIVQALDAQAYQADAFEPDDLFVGQRVWVGGFVRVRASMIAILPGERHDFVRCPPMVQ